jgi:hypothetical protein
MNNLQPNNIKYPFNKGRTYLCISTTIHIGKQNMWSTGTVMKLRQKAIATRILANYMAELKQGPLVQMMQDIWQILID